MSTQVFLNPKLSTTAPHTGTCMRTARALMRISRSGVSPSWLLSVRARKRSLSSASLALEISSRRKISCPAHAHDGSAEQRPLRSDWGRRVGKVRGALTH